MEYLHSDITSVVIQAFYDVYNELGYGFLEKVYKNALFNELTRRGVSCRMESSISVYYKGICVGDYYADIIVEDKVILELKAVKTILPEHLAQLNNYLRATDAEVGLLLNFGLEPQKKRVVFTNDRKKRVII
ncbi:MAG: GxxExxY protein [Prevotella sp.]|nr:GxxExxY protein [Prevotella sp.]